MSSNKPTLCPGFRQLRKSAAPILDTSFKVSRVQRRCAVAHACRAAARPGTLCQQPPGRGAPLHGRGGALGFIQGGITCQTVAGLVVGTETLPTAPPRMAVCAELPQMVLHGVERRD